MLSVGTWNLENLFRPDGSAGADDEAAYEAKLAGLVEVIDRTAPDVLAVQEVGDPDALDDLRARLAGDWDVAVSPEPDRRGIRVGFLSRLVLSDIENVRAFPEALETVRVDDDTTTRQLGRGALRVRVTAGAADVDLVTCHLKSKLLHFPGGRFNPRDEAERARYASYALHLRAAEAVTVRGYADEILDGDGRQRALVVLGDLNDEPLAATTQILLGPPGSELDTPGFNRPDQGDARRLWNLAPRIPADRRFTRVFSGRPELIDHILVSQALVTRVDSVDTSSAELRSVGSVPTARRGGPPSDHAAVVARFAVG